MVGAKRKSHNLFFPNHPYLSHLSLAQHPPDNDDSHDDDFMIMMIMIMLNAHADDVHHHD